MDENAPYQTSAGAFQRVCRNCKKTKTEHAEGRCLFDSTTWAPMPVEEWNEWRKGLLSEIGKIGADFIREEMKTPSLLERLRIGNKRGK